MTYKETLEWMFHQLPMYQLQGASAYKKDLTNAILLAKYLGNPEKKLRTIHVAGTNGKGSTSHMLASILQESGYKVGLYTSPHLKDYKERIKINGVEIAEEFVVNFISKHKLFFESNELSFFEMTVGLAFEYFYENEVDIAVIEVGMGGRLDATNIITPLVSIITNIGLDHTAFLGSTLDRIATEKAGIIKETVPVVIGEYTTETKKVFLEKAIEQQSEIYFASEIIKENYPSDLIGTYQIHNKKTVLQAVTVLQSKYGFAIADEKVKIGLLQVIKNTGLQGRWHQLGENPKVICDTAHNINGLEIVLQQLKTEKFEHLHLVLGFVNDKNLDEILPLFPKNGIYYFCSPAVTRGLPTDLLQLKATENDLQGKVYLSVSEAYKAAIRQAKKSDLIFVGGSTFVVAEIL